MTTHRILSDRAKHVLAEYVEQAAQYGYIPGKVSPGSDGERLMEETLNRLISIFDGPEQREADAQIETELIVSPVLPMTLRQFQAAAVRTINPPGKNHFFSKPPINQGGSYADVEEAEFNQRQDLIHAILGLGGELGELMDPVKKSMFYGKPLDVENIREEAGDLLWYIAGPLCRALGCTLEDLARQNVAKLQKRYPEKYTDQAAIDRADKADVGDFKQ